ncbi:hypothetical protein GCM10022225_51160 [Plantactinospora mayteni]|uniref:Uncharacterized protein n=1 Tax=Plantactinospora mayteni TaxID=566021 RepID=A0ABQ4F498_9ACTN|nr:hypothetical protein Pma05_82770 [Plantactinospora mayteni]
MLAMALNVPPVLLIYPLGKRPNTFTAPEHDTDTWSAISWFAGQHRPARKMLGTDEEADIAEAIREWEHARDVFDAYERHEALVRRYRYTRDQTITELKRLAEPSLHDQNEESKRALQAGTDLFARDLARAVDTLRQHRNIMVHMGYVLPNLPSDIDLS